MAPAHCPSCRKEFRNHTSVARHMSQPRSGCNNWLEDLIKLNSTLPLTEDPMAVDNTIDEGPSYEQGEDVSFYDLRTEGGHLDFEASGHSRTRDEVVTDYFPQPLLAFEEGYTFLSLFDADKNSVYRKKNLYYLFSDRREWQLALWLLHSGLSMGQINDFLALDISQVIPTSHPTKSPAVLYWQDPLECIASLFNHPLFHNRIDYMACKVYNTAEKLSRTYTEWMTGEHAWEMQSALPHGATLLGTILSSDKTCITALSGDHIAHPLLISIANIHMDIRLKSSSNAFLLAALLPVLKFIHKNK
ncbi:uncharacterized protein F5147DRAFT_779555 [Suillus discolor]|uniref:Uncharacterized protein n=1 Tax=Suillus discolor TaxID=1912936 RepID=A0A9P7EWY1_9AGAM|nr:uncharacterized protein F5147DRAFT_779555 [Suillus discolor]KAG2092812.1 hypothetical protein F5147DRAFT_779555 [Suillus discolor]